ncbi:MAG: hypothetical protein L6416_12400 [Candidatus Omnitrophica bacterium]|nr:hypothetical protein [Candidatus Omnitrophota bacterium]
MGKNLWLKIIVVIIIQALLLTQVDFALASIYQSKDTFREAALRFQKITTKSASLVIGIGCVELAFSNIHLPRFSLNNLFSLLKGSSSTQAEISRTGTSFNLNNEFYKALVCLFDNSNLGANILLGYNITQDVRKIIARARVEESTGPPIANAQLRYFLLNRIV